MQDDKFLEGLIGIGWVLLAVCVGAWLGVRF